jgi:AraC-like DNA-binding protein
VILSEQTFPKLSLQDDAPHSRTSELKAKRHSGMNLSVRERQMQDDLSPVQMGADLAELVDRIRTAEFEHACRSLAGGRPAPQVLEQFAHDVTAKFLHGSMQVLDRAGAAQRAEFRSLLSQIERLHGAELTDETTAERIYVETASLTLAARSLQKHCISVACAPTESSAHGLDRIRLRRVLDYIAANIKDDITLVDLAGVAAYSPFHFARKFTLAMGISPQRYISRIRLENAMAELAAGKLQLAEIALNAHFSSQASFTRAFHRVTGMTPKEYQRHRKSAQ